MSLKAKIEAVIYASEEPVTLAQLVGVLGLEAQHELDAREDRQERLRLAPEEGEEEAAELEEGAAGGEGSVEGAAVAAPADAAVETKAARYLERDRERRLREFVREQVEALIADYAPAERGLEVREVAGGYRIATKPEYHDAVRGFVRSLKPPLRLTLQALETLAVVAYKQPVTSPEISEIRGVDSGGVLGSLMGRKLITTAGRKQVIGRPILYKTTKDFLLRFGLKDIAELPSIEEFEKLAGELGEQEEIPMAREQHEGGAETRLTGQKLEEEMSAAGEATEPQADGDSDDLDAENVREGDASRPGRDELTSLTGRTFGMLRREDASRDDPSAAEAEIQQSGEKGNDNGN